MIRVKKVLIIGSVWPEPESSAAGSRMMSLISIYLTSGWNVIFASPAGHSEYCADLETLNVEQVSIKMNDSSFDVFVKDLNPQCVVFDRFMVEEQFGWRVTKNCPDALRILNTEDLHFLRKARELAFKNSRVCEVSDLLISDDAKREIASILRCDLSLIISLYEMDLLKNLFKIDEEMLHYHPFLTDEIGEETRATWPPFAERQDFMAIGNFLHSPNYDSIRYLKEEIWPQIRTELPDAKLHIYGAYPSPKVLQLNNVKEGFLVIGRAKSALAVMKQARVCLAPLRFGAGLKGKLFDAMLCGTPSVTTPVGAEAMHGNLPWNGFIRHTALEISQAAVKLFNDEEVWNSSVENGLEILNQCYNQDFFTDKLNRRIGYLSENLETHRLHNFTGAMLMHHTLKSTEYMSRWIEEKNKKIDA